MKTRFVWICIIVCMIVSCQKEQVDIEKSDDELKRIESKYGIKFEEVTEKDSQNFIFIPFEKLQDILENNTGTVSRAGTSDVYRTIASWIAKRKVTLSTDNVYLNYSIPFKIDLKINLGLGFGADAYLNFEKAMVSYGKQVAMYYFKWGKCTRPSFNKHLIEGYADISFSTEYNGKRLTFTGELGIFGEIPMGKDMITFPTNYVMSLQVTFMF